MGSQLQKLQISTPRLLNLARRAAQALPEGCGMTSLGPPSDLAELAELWPSVPEAVRKSIVVMTKAAARNGSDG